jgi:hypothetical protein
MVTKKDVCKQIENLMLGISDQVQELFSKGVDEGIIDLTNVIPDDYSIAVTMFQAWLDLNTDMLTGCAPELREVHKKGD